MSTGMITVCVLGVLGFLILRGISFDWESTRKLVSQLSIRIAELDAQQVNHPALKSARELLERAEAALQERQRKLAYDCAVDGFGKLIKARLNEI